MSSNETITEYRAVGIFEDGEEGVGDWGPPGVAARVARRWRSFGHSTRIEARDIGPVRVVDEIEGGV